MTNVRPLHTYDPFQRLQKASGQDSSRSSHCAPAHQHGVGWGLLPYRFIHCDHRILGGGCDCGCSASRITNEGRPDLGGRWFCHRTCDDVRARATGLVFGRPVVMKCPNPLPAANSRRSICFRWCGEIRCSLSSSGLGSPAAVAEGGRSVTT